MARNPRTTEKAENAEHLKRETDKITSKIDAAFEKLAKKYRDKSDGAKAKMETAKGKPKRDIQLRRFELYSDAAHQLEGWFEGRKTGSESD